MRDRRVVVTGGSGFVGTNLVTHFAGQGWDVQNFDIVAPRNREHLNLWRQLDILDRERLIAATTAFRPSAFLHFAARTDLEEGTNLGGYAANVEGVCNVIEAVRATPSLQRVVFASSQLVCRLGYVPKDEYDFRPSTVYGQSKALAERIIRAADDIGAVWTIVRPTSLWGPWFDVPYRDLFVAIARGLYVHVGKTNTLKQWGFVGNSVYQIHRLIQAPADLVSRRTVYLADYEPVELWRFADTVQAALGARPIRTVPVGVVRIAARIGDLAETLGWNNPPLTNSRYENMVTPEVQDLGPLESIVGPLPFTVEQGIDITARWLRDVQSKARPRDSACPVEGLGEPL